MELAFQNKKNIKAAIWTIAVHLLLILSLIWIKYQPSLQENIEEYGIEVNLGTTDNAFGFDQPQDMRAYNNSVTIHEGGTVSNRDVSSEFSDNVLTENAVSAPDLSVVPRNNRRTEQIPITPQPPTPPQPKPRHVYTGSAGSNTSGNEALRNRAAGSEGIGVGEGDMGVIGGTPGAVNYTGTPGRGNAGVSYRLSNRKLEGDIGRNADFNVGGKVIFNITVNRKGEITDSRIAPQSSTDKTLQTIAKEKLKRAKFTEDISAPPEQFGTITFEFKVVR